MNRHTHISGQNQNIAALERRAGHTKKLNLVTNNVGANKNVGDTDVAAISTGE